MKSVPQGLGHPLFHLVLIPPKSAFLGIGDNFYQPVRDAHSQVVNFHPAGNVFFHLLIAGAHGIMFLVRGVLLVKDFYIIDFRLTDPSVFRMGFDFGLDFEESIGHLNFLTRPPY